MRRSIRFAIYVLGLCLLGPIAAQEEVSVYCSLDAEHSQKLLEAFEKSTGIKVRFNMDTEDNKTVGLINKIISEAANPRCDVLWNNEVAQTIRLKKKGLLQPYVSPSATDIPAAFKDKDGYWTGFAARARVIIYNKEKIGSELPKGMLDLADPRWKGKVTMAKPITGTTLTQAGALFSVWGEAKAKTWYGDLARSDIYWNLGNAQVMRDVGEGGRAWGYTDTDDANEALERKYPTATIIPDQGPDAPGTLLIPNSVAILKGAKNLGPAKKLVDYVLSRDVEAALAAGRSVQIPVRADVPTPPNVLKIGTFKTMTVDWDAVADAIEQHGPWLNEIYGGKIDNPGKKSTTAMWIALGVVFVIAGGLVIRARTSRD